MLPPKEVFAEPFPELSLENVARIADKGGQTLPFAPNSGPSIA